MSDHSLSFFFIGIAPSLIVLMSQERLLCLPSSLILSFLTFWRKKIKLKNKIMYQKCPICNGTGVLTKDYSENSCKTCNGKGIISEITGLPPNILSEVLGIPKDKFNSGDFRDNCEQFEDK